LKIWFIAEKKDGELRRVSRELAAKAATLGELEILEVTGERVSGAAAASALAERAQAGAPDLILTGATPSGRDVAARLAAKLKRAYLSECTDLAIAGSSIEATRAMYAGKVRARVRAALPAVASVRPNVFPLADGTPQPQITALPAGETPGGAAEKDDRQGVDADREPGDDGGVECRWCASIYGRGNRRRTRKR